MPTNKSKGTSSGKRPKSRKPKGSFDDAQRRLMEMKLQQAEKLRAQRALNMVPPKPPGKYDDKSDFFKWIYSIPFSRYLRFIPKDFSDGVLVAEIVKHYAPRMVDLHSYLSYVGKQNKISNWILLNRKVFSRYLNMRVTPAMIEQFVSPVPKDTVDIRGNKWYPIEKFLVDLRDKLAKVNPNLYSYRARPSNYMNNNDNTLRPCKVIRPFTRQPVTEIMWRVETLNAAKYGRYKGNPITWDDIPEYYEKATLEQLGVGVSKERYRRLIESWRGAKLNDTAPKNSTSTNSVDAQCNTSPEDFLQPRSVHPAASSCSFQSQSSSRSHFNKAIMTSPPASVSSSSVHSVSSSSTNNAISGNSGTGSVPPNLPHPKPPQRRYKIACPVPCSIETDFPVNLICSPDSNSIKIVSCTQEESQSQNSQINS